MQSTAQVGTLGWKGADLNNRRIKFSGCKLLNPWMQLEHAKDKSRSRQTVVSRMTRTAVSKTWGCRLHPPLAAAHAAAPPSAASWTRSAQPAGRSARRRVAEELSPHCVLWSTSANSQRLCPSEEAVTLPPPSSFSPPAPAPAPTRTSGMLSAAAASSCSLVSRHASSRSC